VTADEPGEARGSRGGEHGAFRAPGVDDEGVGGDAGYRWQYLDDGANWRREHDGFHLCNGGEVGRSAGNCFENTGMTNDIGSVDADDQGMWIAPPPGEAD
jgi:hypothetical protein